jgi:elongation factor G
MAVYEVGKYRNLALVGHGGSGKTQLAEALLFKTGATTRLGSPADKSSILDFSEEEKEKGTSLQSSLAFFSHRGLHVNLIDTPGTQAFCGEAIAALAAVECAVVVISATAGVQVNTRKMFQRARDQGLGVWIVINHIDAATADLPAIHQQVRETFGASCVAMNLPAGGGTKVVDCTRGGSGEVDFSSVGEAHTALVESIVGADDELMEQYLGGELDPTAVQAAASTAVAKGACIPILFTNSKGDVGITEFLDALETFCPSPVDGPRRKLVTDAGETEIVPSQDGPFIAQVFKVSSDPRSHIKYLAMRVHSGRLTSDQTLRSEKEPKGMRPGQLVRTLGAEHREVEAGVAGDIISVAKLDLSLGDTVVTDKIGAIAMPRFPKPMFSLAVESSSKGDADKLTASLRQLQEEDPCFYLDRGTGGELVVHGMGELQLQTFLARAAKQHKLELQTRPPRIPYRETIIGRADNVEYTHKKQTGGAGQFGRVILNVYPAERGEGYEFLDKIFGGAIDHAFRPSVDKGVRAQMAEGVIAGYPVVDVKVELIDGKTHPVDSKDIAFQIAGRGAFKEGFLKAKPVLLEPIVSVEATVPSDNVGDITGDLASRRGRPQGQEILPGGLAVVQAIVPLAELSDYNSRLSSITGGQGSYTLEFSHYEVVPSNVQQQIIEQHKKEMQAA